MSIPTSESRRCPKESVWDELAAGLTSGREADELLTHAATCEKCAETLRDAITVFAVDEGHAPIEKIRERPTRRVISRFQYVAAAAVVTLCVGSLVLWNLRAPPATLRLLADAYSGDRRFELRIPGAAHGTVRIERSTGERGLSAQTPELLELAARIARQSREQPTDAIALHARGRLALLEWKPGEAIEALQAARSLGASQPDVTIDLASAYFQRAEIQGADGAADYTLAIDLLGRVIQQDPKNTAARFNRAVIAERLHLLAPAISDLEEVLRWEQSSAWRKEAEGRLTRLRRALKGFLDRTLEADRQRFAEVALERELSEGFTDQIANTAERLQREHSDVWLPELIAHRELKYQELFRQLSTLASIRATSARGRYSAELELLRGWETASLPPALSAWRDYEAAYRATHSGGQFQCNSTTSSENYRRRSYYWIAANLEREAAICASFSGAIASSVERSRRAVAIAQEARLIVTTVRNKAIATTFEYRQGRYRETLTQFTAMLGQIISNGLPIVRSHEPLHNMVVATSALGRHYASQLAATMATLVADSSGLQSAQFADRVNGANEAFRAGDRVAATELYRQALKLHDHAPSIVTTPDSRPWAEMILAELAGRSVLPKQLAGSKDPFIRLPYARLKAKQEESTGQVEAALARLDESMRWLVEARGPRHHQVWRQELRSTADDLLRLVVRRRPAQESFIRLQQLFGADEASLRTGSLRRSGWRPDIVFSLAVLGQDVYVWRREGDSVGMISHLAFLPRIEAASRRLRILVSSPNHSVAGIQAEALNLTKALFGSWITSIGPAKKILFQCEGMLADIPYSLLMTSQGYLGLNHELALTRSAVSGQSVLLGKPSVVAPDQLFVDATHVASLSSWNLPPLPLPQEEQSALRLMPGRLLELQGAEAFAARLRQALGSTGLLHFAGHAVARNGTIGLLLEDGLFELDGAQAPSTVVLSACSTGKAYQEEVDTLSAGTLAHAFVLAGAAEVIASSWNLDSLAASAFASAFYARLGSGEDLGMAILGATRHVAAVPVFTHPYYWAGQMRLIRT